MMLRPLRFAVLLALPLFALPAFADSLAFILPTAAAASPAASAEMVEMALRYEHGESVPRDYLHAASLYCSAARAGNADALYGLGWMYANGRGMPVDDAFAAHLFKLAAEAGHQHARTLIQRFPSANDPELPPCLAPDKENLMAQPQREAQEDIRTGRDLRNISGAKIHQLVTKLAPRYQIDANLAMAIIYMESGFNARALSPKNAQGLMQLIPETAQRFKVKNAFDAEENIKGGLAYLRWLLAYFKGDVALVAAAYNAGEGAVERYKGVPPYAETKAYVAKLAGLYKRSLHPFDAGAAATSASFTTSNRQATVMLRAPL